AIAEGKVTIDGANVVKTDVETSNGVIHVIDTVIIPEG
ncbi:MAG: fasciclin domain-containing protein, partial [Verrucomicrobiota bacterium]